MSEERKNKYDDMFCLECVFYNEVTETCGECMIDQTTKDYASECDKPNKFSKQRI